MIDLVNMPKLAAARQDNRALLVIEARARGPRAPESRMSLRTQVLSGVFWVGSARVLSQITNWAISIVVIRLPTPADYGLLAMATVFLSFVVIFAEAGMGVALIQAKDLNEAVLRSAFGAIIAISVALVGLMYLAAPFLSPPSTTRTG